MDYFSCTARVEVQSHQRKFGLAEPRGARAQKRCQEWSYIPKNKHLPMKASSLRNFLLTTKCKSANIRLLIRHKQTDPLH